MQLLASAAALLLQLLAALQFYLYRHRFPVGETFWWQFSIFLGISVILTLLLANSREQELLILLAKLALYLLMSYPLGEYTGVELSLLLALLLESGVYLSFYSNIGMMLLAILASEILHGSRSAFYRDVSAPTLHDQITVTITALIFGTLVLALVYYFRKFQHREKRIAHLDAVISQISTVNLSFQQYLHAVEYEIINNERKRLSREIHDSVGYSLTNILMTLEAVNAIIDNDPAKTEKLIQRSIEEARNCLEQTRSSMRALRNKELQEPSGTKAIAHLVRSFRDATGIDVRVEYGNIPDSLDPEIDRVVFRFIQESLTNAFRHGMCSRIQIHFWIDSANRLFINVRDNGVGAMDVVEGIGLKGMRERIEAVMGELRYSSSENGFQLRAEIPILLPL